MGCSQNSFGLGVRVVRVTGNPALVTGVGSLQVVIPLVLEISDIFVGDFSFFFTRQAHLLELLVKRYFFFRDIFCSPQFLLFFNQNRKFAHFILRIFLTVFSL